ncbi:hypothetical protein P5P86_14915 [Nocardioides sp. BP30]|uniref:AtpZ/AtpI family protein n=1 Tax=Nocardioides sp. BP30 TaxID=3036374 RepID=UPI0024694007|nr:hypothetical protein [Nocardioides sp. BP30]WGL51247.1 hypothetical protein P5P86_14915 [Nocardioides sp. BP30]
MNDPERSSQDDPHGDPWRAFAYTVSGVAVYGLIGWLLDRWLGTSFLVAVGICAGAAMGIYMTWARFSRSAPPQPQQPHQHDPHHKT